MRIDSRFFETNIHYISRLTWIIRLGELSMGVVSRVVHLAITSKIICEAYARNLCRRLVKVN